MARREIKIARGSVFRFIRSNSSSVREESYLNGYSYSSVNICPSPLRPVRFKLVPSRSPIGQHSSSFFR